MQSQVIILCGFVFDIQQIICVCLFVCLICLWNSPVCFCHNAVQYKPHANPSSLCLSVQQLSSTLNLKCKNWILHFKQIMVFTWNQTQADTKQTVDPECVLMVQDACMSQKRSWFEYKHGLLLHITPIPLSLNQHLLIVNSLTSKGKKWKKV